MPTDNNTLWNEMLNASLGQVLPSAIPTSDAYATPMENLINPAFIKFRDESRFWVQRVLLPLIGTIGVFGNVITIVVLTRRGMRSSTNNYLTALAISDLVYLLCVLWLSLKHYPVDGTMWVVYAYTEPYSLWLADASTNTSVWLTATFTVERYIAVCHPIRGRGICTESRARRVILAVYVICFTTTMTTPFEWSVVDQIDPLTNISRPLVKPSALGEDDTYKSVYYWFISITFVLLPLVLLIIFNSFLIQSVRQSQKLRRTMTLQTSESEDRAVHNEIRITVTLIAVVIMFLVCQLPTAAMLIYNIFHEPDSVSNEYVLLLGLGNIFNLLVSFNAACNFVLYCALSDKYRTTFMLTFCHCFVTRPVTLTTTMSQWSPDVDGHLTVSPSQFRDSSMRFKQRTAAPNASTLEHSFTMSHGNTYMSLPASQRNGNGALNHLGKSPRTSKWWPWNIALKYDQTQQNNIHTQMSRSADTVPTLSITQAQPPEMNHVAAV